MSSLSSTQLNLTAIIPTELDGLRLDVALAQLFPEHSRARMQNWIRAEQVQVDKKIIRAKDKVRMGQQVQICAELIAQTHWEAQAIRLDICYEDNDIIVVNKPAGLVVHPAPGNPDQTLVNALLHYAPELAQLPRAGIIHRLDKDTSGLLIIARSLTAHTRLINQMQAREIKREYLAVAQGALITGGTIDLPIGRHPTQRTRMAVQDNGKPAVTHYRILQRYSSFTVLKVILETGRTHQIRVHLAHLGYPLVGDPVYGGRLKIPKNCSEELKTLLQNFKRQALHAQYLTFLHPNKDGLISLEAPVPADLGALLETLKTR